jgi:hypothetical protein
MAAKNHTVTDHSHPSSKRVELATAAAWQITTLCRELLEQAATIEDTNRKPLHHSALVIKLLVSRALELAEVTAHCLEEDEANEPFAELKERMSHG